MTATQTAPALTGRWELIRALGAICDTPEAAATAARHLDLGQLDASEHTHVFVMNAPPYSAIHLGAEGMLGGEAADRVAGFWRALGLTPPSEPDHLSTLLALYAHLGEAEDQTTRTDTRAALARRRHALLWEHLWPWVPGYTQAVADLEMPILSPWADLLRQALDAELAEGIAGLETTLPAALRDAPEPLCAEDAFAELLDRLIAPIRTGTVITRDSLARAAGEIGVGHRIGERRFTLRAMFEQDLAATLRWLASEVARWQARRLGQTSSSDIDLVTGWWLRRCGDTATALMDLAETAESSDPTLGTALILARPNDRHAVNSLIAALTFLLGTWEGEGRGLWPADPVFRYREHVEFAESGGPFVAYRQRTVAYDGARQLHSESGYLRPGPRGYVEFVLAQPTGLVEVHTGHTELQRIDLRSTMVGRTARALAVTDVTRTIEVEGSTLHYDLGLAMNHEPVTPHLRGRLERTSGHVQIA